ncbi:hypothetical protein ACPXA8_27610, partial [Klebsiella pneumoniae]|uniref:hypothetical protein n=1 Tax=Klebsiella pneumoniae TaxID=573 RepID=UPI003CF1EFA0
ARQKIPSILIIYNALDEVFHTFGTETHDFTTAMHGELTAYLDLNRSEIVGAAHGLNSSFRENQNTSFAALGHLRPVENRLTVRLFPNV